MPRQRGTAQRPSGMISEMRNSVLLWDDGRRRNGRDPVRYGASVGVPRGDVVLCRRPVRPHSSRVPRSQTKEARRKLCVTVVRCCIARSSSTVAHTTRVYDKPLLSVADTLTPPRGGGG